MTSVILTFRRWWLIKRYFWNKKATGGREKVCFCPQFQVIVHHCREVRAARTWGSEGATPCPQSRAETSMWMPSVQLAFSTSVLSVLKIGMVLITFRLVVNTTSISNQDSPQRPTWYKEPLAKTLPVCFQLVSSCQLNQSSPFSTHRRPVSLARAQKGTQAWLGRGGNQQSIRATFLSPASSTSVAFNLEPFQRRQNLVEQDVGKGKSWMEAMGRRRGTPRSAGEGGIRGPHLQGQERRQDWPSSL